MVLKRFFAFCFALMIAVCFMAFPNDSYAAGQTTISELGKYSEGLVQFRDGSKKTGYMDVSGNVVIKPQYSHAEPFHNGYAAVYTVKGKKVAADYQFIDPMGKVVFRSISNGKREYDYEEWLGDYCQVLIWEKKNGERTNPIGFNFLNSKGKLITKDEYLYISGFHEGYAVVGTGSYSPSKKKATMTSMNDVHCLMYFSGNTGTQVATTFYYIDMQGNQLGNLTWSYARPFSDGMAAVTAKGANGSSTKYGFIDLQGDLAIPPAWDEVGDFHNGYAYVKNGDLYGYIDKTGKEVISCKYAGAYDFGSNGLAVVRTEDKKYFLINAQEEKQFDQAYDSMLSQPDPDRYLVKDGVAWGMIDSKGNVLISPSFSYAQFANGLFVGTEFDTPIIINEKGEMITVVLVDGSLPTEEQAAEFQDGASCTLMTLSSDESGLPFQVFLGENNRIISMNLFGTVSGESFTITKGTGKKMVFNSEGEQIGTEKWDDVLSKASSDYVVCVQKDGLQGLISRETGEVIVNPGFSSFSEFSAGYTMGTIGNNPYFYDIYGRKVLPEINKSSSKDDIIAFQQRLIDRGYLTGKADGKFSKNLVAAIEAAQEALGLEVTGKADSYLQYALLE